MAQHEDIDWAIKVENVSKTFKLPHEKQTSLKGLFLSSFNKKKYEKQKAVNDVSFDIKKGEFFGIVGRNGSGKSTLLKMIAGVYQPNKGKIKINGSLVPFIELGVGFNPELTGRDNVFLNGALLGFSRKQMEEMYNEIVEFAELERFMDQKLKNYSSGMQVRLAFSIAIRAQSDILLLDEVLAVGDSAFQQKCFDYFAQLKRTNKTVILVTHDMGAIEKYCDRAVLVRGGSAAKLGSPYDISYAYSIENNQSYLHEELENQRKKNFELQQKKGISLKLTNKDGKETNTFSYGDTAVLKISWGNLNIKNVGVAILKNTGDYVFGANTILDEVKINHQSVDYRVKLSLGNGRYTIKVGFFGGSSHDKIFFIDQGPSLVMRAVKEQRWDGTVKLKHDWVIK